ncbi:fatty acid desaturase [Chromobacterium vaccinii]|uniref:fatty acid desaturase n=1 Tax=Chromobacterium vaccinii TaxID=1108595 RepID=UPI003C793B5B
MPADSHGLIPVATPDVHRRRRQQILAAHPEVRRLFGPNRWTFVLMAALVAAQFALAWQVRTWHAWQVFAIAYCGGAYLSAALFALIHDASHGLVFSGAARNRLAAIFANLPLVFWSAMPFFRYHGAHHARFGDYRWDVGVPTRAEAEWVGNVGWRKALWLAAFPLFQGLRVGKYPAATGYWDRWMVLNAALQALASVWVGLAFGGMALLYLLLSMMFTMGLHPLGSRVVQEHFVVRSGQESNDFIGWANALECYFGLHAEHHDFMRIPWNRLPRLRRLAAEFYEGEAAFGSRAGLMLDFIFNPRWSLRDNIVRIEARSDETG